MTDELLNKENFIAQCIVLTAHVGRVLLLIALTVILVACGPVITSDVITQSPPTAVTLPTLSEPPALQSPLPTPSPIGAEDLIVVSETRLTVDGGVMGGVAVSPRGDRIAFLGRSDQFIELSPNLGRMITPLWVMDRKGENAVQIAEDAQWPTWEPNGLGGGSRLVYVQRVQPERAVAYVVNVQAKQSRALGEIPWQRLFWEKPGQVAFVNERRFQIWSDGQIIERPALLLPEDVDMLQIYPSPDRRKIFFARKQELWLADAQTGQAQKIAGRFLGFVNGVAWSPTSDRVAFPLHHNGLWVMDLATGEQKKISDLTVTGVTWSPQGDVLAFTGQNVAGSGTAMFTEIYLINVDGTGIRQLTQNEIPDSVAAWLPDSLDLLIGRSTAEGGYTDLRLLSLAIRLHSQNQNEGENENSLCEVLAVVSHYHLCSLCNDDRKSTGCKPMGTVFTAGTAFASTQHYNSQCVSRL